MLVYNKKSNKIFYENISDLSGLSKNHPMLSLSFLILLFSLAGIPPLAGFFAKFYIFMSVIEQQMYFLAIIGLLSTVIAAFYYLRIIKIIYFDPEKEKYDTDHNLGLKTSLIISTLLILLYFTYPSPLIKIILYAIFIKKIKVLALLGTLVSKRQNIVSSHYLTRMTFGLNENLNAKLQN